MPIDFTQCYCSVTQALAAHWEDDAELEEIIPFDSVMDSELNGRAETAYFVWEDLTGREILCNSDASGYTFPIVGTAHCLPGGTVANQLIRLVLDRYDRLARFSTELGTVSGLRITSMPTKRPVGKGYDVRFQFQAKLMRNA